MKGQSDVKSTRSTARVTRKGCTSSSLYSLDLQFHSLTRFSMRRQFGAVPLELLRQLRRGDARRGIAGVARAAFELVLPPRCAWCLADVQPSDDEPLLCEECRREMLGRTTERCPRCGGAVTGAAARCPRCHDRRLHFDHVFALGSYTDALRQCVLRLKGPGNEALATAMGQLLAEPSAKGLALLKPDAIIAVPMYWVRRLVRRANNAELIAAAVAARLGVPLWHRAVRRVRHTRKQGPMLRTERLRNVTAPSRAARIRFRASPHPRGRRCSHHGRHLRRNRQGPQAVGRRHGFRGRARPGRNAPLRTD